MRKITAQYGTRLATFSNTSWLHLSILHDNLKFTLVLGMMSVKTHPNVRESIMGLSDELFSKNPEYCNFLLELCNVSNNHHFLHTSRVPRLYWRFLWFTVITSPTMANQGKSVWDLACLHKRSIDLLYHWQFLVCLV